MSVDDIVPGDEWIEINYGDPTDLGIRFMPDDLITAQQWLAAEETARRLPIHVQTSDVQVWLDGVVYNGAAAINYAHLPDASDWYGPEGGSAALQDYRRSTVDGALGDHQGIMGFPYILESGTKRMNFAPNPQNFWQMAWNGGFSVFVVARWDNELFSFDGTHNVFMGSCDDDGGNGAGVSFGPTSLKGCDEDGLLLDAEFDGPTADGQWHIWTYDYNLAESPGNRLSESNGHGMWFDDVRISDGDTTIAVDEAVRHSPPAMTQAFYLGRDPNDNTAFDGAVAEVLIFYGSLTTTQMAWVRDYLARRWLGHRLLESWVVPDAPSGGGTVDTEARAEYAQLIEALQAAGEIP